MSELLHVSRVASCMRHPRSAAAPTDPAESLFPIMRTSLSLTSRYLTRSFYLHPAPSSVESQQSHSKLLRKTAPPELLHFRSTPSLTPPRRLSCSPCSCISPLELRALRGSPRGRPQPRPYAPAMPAWGVFQTFWWDPMLPLPADLPPRPARP